MNKHFNGFDVFKPDNYLKNKTRERIIAKNEKTATPKKPMYRKPYVIAATCLAAVLIVSLSAVNLFGMYKTENMYDAHTMMEERSAPKDSDGGGRKAAKREAEKELADEYALGYTDDGEEWSDDLPAKAPSEGNAADRMAIIAESQTAGTLTAKVFCDNDDFSLWRDIAGEDGMFYSFAQRWGINTTDRVVVNVKNGQSAVCGAKVVLLDTKSKELWSAVTDNKGRTYLFYNFAATGEKPDRISVSMGDVSVDKPLDEETPQEISVELSAKSVAKSLDLMFVVDTTSSMGDELEYIQAELEDIINRVEAEQAGNPLRLSVNFYRDEGDDYVVRPFPFVADFSQAISDLKKQNAIGGGDFEEAVEQALDSAIHDHDWSDAYAKLLFLVLDAPPHDEAAEKMRALTRDAAGLGIRIIPITGSGIDQNTEFLMRAIDVATGGTYVPLTDDSGIGGEHLEPTIGESPVYKLNDLIVKIVGDYMK